MEVLFSCCSSGEASYSGRAGANEEGDGGGETASAADEGASSTPLKLRAEHIAGLRTHRSIRTQCHCQ